MATLTELLAAAREASQPRPDEVERLRAALLDELGADPALTARLQGVGGADPEAVARVRARLQQSVQARKRRAAGVALLAVAATALLSVLLRPAPPTLLRAERPGTFEAIPGVVLRHQGDGRVRGEDSAPQVDWHQGDLEVEVEHGRGIALTVHTPDGEVEVVGTVFDVHCDALGTHVDVQRGEVAVRCGHGEHHALTPGGDGASCLPVTPGRLLGRARTLLRQGAALELVLDAVDRGLAEEAPEDLASELLATRLEALAGAGRRREAREAAERYLALFPEGPRRAEVETFLRRR